MNESYFPQPPSPRSGVCSWYEMMGRESTRPLQLQLPHSRLFLQRQGRVHALCGLGASGWGSPELFG